MLITYPSCARFESVSKHVHCTSDITLHVHVTFLTLFIFMILAALDDCDSTWSFRDGRCYKLFTSEVTWSNALKTCQANSANLVNIADSGENAFVYGNFLVTY